LPAARHHIHIGNAGGAHHLRRLGHAQRLVLQINPQTVEAQQADQLGAGWI
jgi:hypothetical protein